MALTYPTPTPDTELYWAKARAGELWIKRCLTTGRYFFYPQDFSPFVAGGETEWVQAEGSATLYSYTIVHRAMPGFEERAPYAVAVVELAEGPRLMANIVGIENSPENLLLDMDLIVDFESRGDFEVPVFRPAVTA